MDAITSGPMFPRELAARDTRGSIKLIRNRGTLQLLGARILAPEGSELLVEISLAIKHGITTEELASSFHPYLTLSEGVKLAAILQVRGETHLLCSMTACGSVPGASRPHRRCSQQRLEFSSLQPLAQGSSCGGAAAPS